MTTITALSAQASLAKEVAQSVKEWRMLEAGMNPSGIGAFDDEDGR